MQEMWWFVVVLACCACTTSNLHQPEVYCTNEAFVESAILGSLGCSYNPNIFKNQHWSMCVSLKNGPKTPITTPIFFEKFHEVLYMNYSFLIIKPNLILPTAQVPPTIPFTTCLAYQRCKSESKNFGPPKMSESDSDFGRSPNVCLGNLQTGHQLQQIVLSFTPLWAYGAQFKERLHFASVFLSVHQ